MEAYMSSYFYYPPSLVWYQKPAHVDISRLAASLIAQGSTDKSKYSLDKPSHSDGSKNIPRKLQLDRVLANQTCSPMSLYDFRMYCTHVEHSVENLEFYTWFAKFQAGQYTTMINSKRSLTATENTLHRPGTSSTARTEVWDLPNPEAPLCRVPRASTSRAAHLMPFISTTKTIFSNTSAYVPPTGQLSVSDVECNNTTIPNDHASNQSEAFAAIEGLKRAEIEYVKARFFLPGSPMELNISSSMRKQCLENIANSTDPKHFADIAEQCYILLQGSHKNFVRRGVSNGTLETVCMATSLGIVLVLGGFLTIFLLAFCSPSIHHRSRWIALPIWPMWAIGMALILSGLRGSCFFLLLFSRRQPMPWERFEDEGTIKERFFFVRLVSKLMIFDRKMKVQDDILRRLQRKIVIQSVVGGIIFASLMELLFLILPIWDGS